MNVQTAEGKRYLIQTAIIEQMNARGAYLNIEHCRDLMSREGQERYRSQWLDCITSLQRTANQAAYAARRNMEAVDLYYGYVS